MQEEQARKIKSQPRFSGIFENGEGFGRRIKLTSHDFSKVDTFVKKVLSDDSPDYVTKLENRIATYIGVPYAVATSSGTSAMHIALKLAAKMVYGSEDLEGKKVFCSDLCPIEQAMPILYENGEPVFIDVTEDDYCMDPECLAKAFALHPETRIVIMNHLYGFAVDMKSVKEVCHYHKAILIENASESFGSKVDGQFAGSFGDIAVLDFDGDKIVSGQSGGIVLVNNTDDADYARKLVNMSKRNLPWTYADTIGFDYCMSNISAAMVIGQFDHIDEIIARKKEIYENYQDNICEDFIYTLYPTEEAEPNYWMPVMMCDSLLEAAETRTESGYSYTDEHGTSSPMEIVDALEAFGAEASPIYTAMSLQPVFEGREYITFYENLKVTSTHEENNSLFVEGISRDASKKCLCLPSDLSMTEDEQAKVVDIVHSCFNKISIDREASEAIGNSCGT